MGRKIPAKKHRGVKDPLVQQAKRIQSLQGRINSPPRDPDDQPAPRSVARLFAPRVPRARPEPRAGPRPAPAPRQPPGAPAALRRAAAEPASHFALRINSSVRALRHDTAHVPDEAADEAREARAARVAELRARRQHRRAQRAPDGAAAEAEAGGNARRLGGKRAARAEAQARARGQGAGAGDGVRYERIAFGDCAHAPPALTHTPRGARLRPGAGTGPGGRRGLLLAAALPGPGAGPGPGPHVSPEEAARLRAVAAYRALREAAAVRERARGPGPGARGRTIKQPV